MKKLPLLFLVLIVAVPVLSFAGTATSAWDMSIGGFIKFDVAWDSQGVGADWNNPLRNDRSGYDSVGAKYPAITWATNYTRLNFSINGPNTLGAKTTACIEGDFRGTSGTTAGGYQLRQAFFKMNWDSTGLMIGHGYQAFGLSGYKGPFLGYNEGIFVPGARQPQIRITQWFTKDFSAAFAITSPNVRSNSVNMGPTVTDETRSSYPGSPACLDLQVAGVR